VIYQSESSLLPALAGNRSQVLSVGEVEDLSCALQSIHNLFSPLIDPNGEDPHFAMEVEFKHVGPERRLVIKQARPHPFAGAPDFGDCREL
jgi:hypothetical protein